VQDVVQHTAGVANLEAAGLNTSHGSGSNDGDSLFVRLEDQLAGHVLRNALGDNGHCPDLGEFEHLERRLVSAAHGSEVDHNIDILVLVDGIGHFLVHGDEDFLVTPIVLLLVIPGEGIYHCHHRRFIASKRIYKIYLFEIDINSSRL